MENTSLMERRIKRGDMFYAKLKFGVGSEQTGNRPVLILQNNMGNKYSRTVIVALITSQVTKKAELPTHCLIQAQNGLRWDSLVLLEHIQTIDKSRLTEYLGTLKAEYIYKVDRALAISVGLKYYENVDLFPR